MKIELSRDWTEFLSALISRRVRFVIVGGHAVAGHGEPRLTEYLDVFVERSPANARKLRQALVDFGFGNVAPTEAELARPHKVFMLGHKPWRIDILTSIDGVSFEQAWKTRVKAEFIVTPLHVIGRAMLIKHKRAAGRDNDLADVAMRSAALEVPFGVATLRGAIVPQRSRGSARTWRAGGKVAIGPTTIR